MTSTTVLLLLGVRLELQFRIRFRAVFTEWFEIAYLGRRKRWLRLRDFDVSTTESDPDLEQ